MEVLCTKTLLSSDIHLLKSSMGEKAKKAPVEQITDKLEDLEMSHEQSKVKTDPSGHGANVCVDILEEEEDLDEEASAMKAMGLPTSFTSSLVIDPLCARKGSINRHVHLDGTIETTSSTAFTASVRRRERR